MSNLKSYVIHTIGGGWGKETIEENLIKVSVIRGTDFPKLEKLDFSSVPIRFETLKKIESRTLQVGDLIIEVSGGSASSGQRTGRCLYITQEILDNLGKYVIPASFCRLLRLDKEKINSKFIYYQIAEMHLSDQIGIYENQSTGISNFQFNLFLDEIFPKITDLNKQNSIVDIFNSIDQKIQVNTKINQTLEQIAQALFKSWFVDFDPVRAKAQALSDGLSLKQAELAAMQAISGKTAEELTVLSQTQPDRYAELAETAKAFPYEMVEVDGVEVPKGWKTIPFKDFIKDKKEKVGNLKNVPEYSVTNNGIIPRSQKFNKQLSKNPEKNKLLHKTDLVFGMSREVLNWGIMEDEIGAVSSAYHIYSINKDKVNYLYLKMLMQNRFEYFNELIRPSSREGQGFDKELLKEKKVTIPCNILLDKFLHDLNTIKSQMNNITQETESLIFIRNLLLPKLLNGEI